MPSQNRASPDACVKGLAARLHAYNACVDESPPHNGVAEKALALLELVPMQRRDAAGDTDLLSEITRALRRRRPAALRQLTSEQHDIAMRLLDLAVHRTGDRRAKWGMSVNVGTLVDLHDQAVDAVYFAGEADSAAAIGRLEVMPTLPDSAVGVVSLFGELVQGMVRRRERN
jgi:hypothetical protein